MFFRYEKYVTEHLKKKDKLLGKAIENIGHINRTVDSDLFSSVVHHIVGQQISTTAQKTVWERLSNKLGTVDANAVCRLSREELQSCGITFRKADYIKEFAEKVQGEQFNIEGLYEMSDDDVIKELTSLRGVGQWTAEMVMIFGMQRMDIVSYKDLAIRRGMRMLYRHRELNKELFNKYARRYSPYGTVASLYLWAIAGGAIPSMHDPGVRTVRTL